MRQKSRIVTGWVIVRQRSSAPPRAEILRVPWRAGLGIGAVLLLLLFDHRAASSSPTYTNSHYRSGELRGGDSLLPNLTATRDTVQTRSTFCIYNNNAKVRGLTLCLSRSTPTLTVLHSLSDSQPHPLQNRMKWYEEWKLWRVPLSLLPSALLCFYSAIIQCSCRHHIIWAYRLYRDTASQGEEDNKRMRTPRTL